MELFKLFGTIALNGVDETHSALDGITNKASGIGSKIASGVGTVAKTVGKATVAAVAATTTAVTAMGKTAIEGYAEYEQLIGGVETLYGASIESVEEYAEKHGIALEEAAQMWEGYQDRQQTVLDNAANAYKTAGMSANEYMNTVNGFAASLISSLGEYEWQAGNYADMIVTDMADNANKMGTSMEAIQNAYSGFSKQNYTMLDNLKLGYGGTKTEMERLLRNAEELEGYFEGAFDINNFADVAEAIHIIQKNMGITGTTAKEAAKTISGSLSAVKASWSNLMTGMSRDDADMSQLISNFTESIEIAAENLLPRIETTIAGIGDMVTELAPFFVESVSKLIKDVAPDLLDAGVELADTLLTSFANSLGEISPALEPIGEMILNVKESLSNVFSMIGESIDWDSVFAGMQEALDVVCGLIENVVGGFEKLVEYATTEGTPLNDLFSNLKESASQVVTWFEENWSKIGDSFDNVKEKLGTAGESIINAFNGIIEEINKDGGISAALDGVLEVVEPLADGFSEIVNLGGSVATIIGDVIEALIRMGKDEGSWLNKAIEWIKTDLVMAWGNATEAIGAVADLLNGDVDAAFNHIKTIGTNTADAIKAKWDILVSTIQQILGYIETVKQEAQGLFATEQLNKEDVTLIGDYDWKSGLGDNPDFSFGSVGASPFDDDWGKSSTPSISDKGNSGEQEFYASGGILTQPTAFGLNPYTGKTMIGGESGAEAIAPIDVLQGYVSEAVEAKTSGMNDTLNRILDALIVMNDNMGVSMREAMEGVSINFGKREFGRAVRTVT